MTPLSAEKLPNGEQTSSKHSAGRESWFPPSGLPTRQKPGIGDRRPRPPQKPACLLTPLPCLTPGRTTLICTRRVLGLCGGAGACWFPAFSTASRARVRGCWAGEAFSGLMFSWSSWGAVCCKVSGAEPASRAAEEPNITAARPRRDPPAAPSSVHSLPPTGRAEERSPGGRPPQPGPPARDGREPRRLRKRRHGRGGQPGTHREQARGPLERGCSGSSSIPRLLKWANDKGRSL